MQRFLLLSLLTVLLSACAAPTSTVAEVTVMPEWTVTSASSLTPNTGTIAVDEQVITTPKAEIPTATSIAEIKSYMNGFEITQTDAIAAYTYMGVKLDATIGVDKSANKQDLHSFEVPDSRMGDFVMRAWRNLVEPDNKGDAEGLVEFANKWAEVQAGDRPCSDLATTFSIFEVGGGDKQEVTLVPACGESPVPEGAVEIKQVDFVFASLFKTGPDGAAIENPDKPWMDNIDPGGGGAGALLDGTRGNLIIFIDPGQLYSSGQPDGTVATTVEQAIDWLKWLKNGLNLNLRRTQNYANRAEDWLEEAEIE